MIIFLVFYLIFIESNDLNQHESYYVNINVTSIFFIYYQNFQISPNIFIYYQLSNNFKYVQIFFNFNQFKLL
jgi:hypothetical protein